MAYGQAALLSTYLQISGLAFFFSPLGLHRTIIAPVHLPGMRWLFWTLHCKGSVVRFCSGHDFLYNLDCAHGLYCILNTLTVTTKQSFFYYLCSKSLFQRTVIFKIFFNEAEVLLRNRNFRVLTATALLKEKVILLHSTITKGILEQINGFYSKKTTIICWVETKHGKFHPRISLLKENYVCLIFQASSAVGQNQF